MRFLYGSDNSVSAISGRLRVAAGQASRLILAGMVLAAGLYALPPAASSRAVERSFLGGNACDSAGEAGFLDMPAGGKGIHPVSSSQGQSSAACHPSLAAEIAEDSPESIESRLASATPGLVELTAAQAFARNQPSAEAAIHKKTPSPTSGQAKHIFWVIPAFQVYNRREFTPLTPQEKFHEWAEGAYDPLGLSAGAFESAVEYSPKDGFCGYGKSFFNYSECFGSAELDANISSFFGDYVFAVLLHQDPRYFRMGEGSIFRRSWYAVSRVFITYTDSGHNTFYSSALGGTVLASGLSNLYYPAQDRGFGLTMSRIAWDLGDTALYNLAAEFWPNIKHGLYRAF